MPEAVDDAIQLLKEQGFDSSAWFDPSDWRVMALIALFGLIIVLWIVRRVRRAARRRRPPTIHPLLQKYGESRTEPDEAFLAKRRAEAARILATSSTAVVAGYEIVEQVEAIFVDGFRRPEDALEGLKAAAALKHATAIVNVRQKRDPSGKCSAHGDAVIVRKAGTPPGSKPSEPHPDMPTGDAGPTVNGEPTTDSERMAEVKTPQNTGDRRDPKRSDAP
ncbi:MAG: hypothetical protein JSU86_20210 [Phycisphaerales bacterium]|nr:MAG: hypothetical protein JSU86_20210 [Phycisphaerales bacterium]